MADELDDQFALDSDVASLSGDSAGGASDAGPSAGPSRAPQGKGDAALDAKESKKRKRKQQQQKRKRRKAEEAAAQAAQKPYPLLPPDVQAERVRQLQKDAFSKLTALELGEMDIPESTFVDVADMCHERRLEDLAAICNKAVPPLRARLDDADSACRTSNGRPALLCVTGNAMRAAELARALRALLPKLGEPGAAPAGKAPGKNKLKPSKDGSAPADAAEKAQAAPTVAKLFARHFKVAEQVAFLGTHISPLAVGTPARLSDLLDHDASPLSLDALELLVIDASWRDAKERTVLDGLDTRADLFKLINREEIKGRWKSGACRILLF